MGEAGTWSPEHPSQDAQICSEEVWEPQGGWRHSQKLLDVGWLFTDRVDRVLGQHGQDEGWALPGVGWHGMGARVPTPTESSLVLGGLCDLGVCVVLTGWRE